MKYFLHDTNAFQDDKITELYINFGFEGLGLFYTLLEKIAMQEKPIKTTVLKAQLNVGKKLEKCWSFMEEIGLISSNNGETFNERILSYNEKYQIKKQKNKEKIAQWRENQENKKNVTSYKKVRNAPKGKVIKGKVIKEKVIKGNKGESDININFSIFWELYDKKVGNIEKLEKKWVALSDEVRQQIIDYIPKYKLNQPDAFYRKNPETFFQNKSWNDELIKPQILNNGSFTKSTTKIPSGDFIKVREGAGQL